MRVLYNHTVITVPTTKLLMRGFADDVMRENGFLPHNGHGYVRSHRASDRNIITTNELSRKRYVNAIQLDKGTTISISTPEPHEYPTRAVNGYLPYHGRIAKDRVDWEKFTPR